MINVDTSIKALVEKRNADKKLFTAGPASLLAENLMGLRPAFGRGDTDYDTVEADVLNRLKEMSGHQQIARLQGSATLALEIAALNFLEGRILVVSTGYYSDRLKTLANQAKSTQQRIQQIDTADWQALHSVDVHYDWVVACYTETSVGLKLPIDLLADLTKRCNSKLMLDATASIGLESGHEEADVIVYSSCKGLFGFTGAAFIAFNEAPQHSPDSYYMNLQTHLNRGVTGPYHTIASLFEVLPKHDQFKQAVINNKHAFLTQFKDAQTHSSPHQPLLCTWVDQVVTQQADRAVLYRPRGNASGSVVCHLGEVHLAENARGDILNALAVEEAREIYG